MYIYDPDKIDEILEKIKDDDSVTLTGRQLRELAETIRKKGKGRKPIALDDDLFDRVVRRWQSGEITARAAMQELDLKPNTFYRRVKERYEDMDELRKELKKAAKEEKRELKELKKQGIKVLALVNSVFAEEIAEDFARKIYGENYIRLQDLSQLAQKVGDLLAAEIEEY